MFQPGTLLDRLTRTTIEALDAGALQPIPTDFEFVEDCGVRFLVRVVSNLARKQHAKVESGGGDGGRPNPFLPHDPAMYVADASEMHICLLNKYNVVDRHLLIVTRQFEHQQSPLTLADFKALLRCMAEYDSLGFYNGGTISGASQAHKHLQLVPLPISPEGPRIPIEPLLVAAGFPGRIGRADGLPFPHALARFDPRSAVSLANSAETAHSLYCQMMNVIGLAPDAANSDRIASAYNLLVAREWMLLVPRIRERFESISLNALAFAGALLVRTEREMESLKRHGPMCALEHVAKA